MPYILRRELVKAYWLSELVPGSYSIRIELLKGGERTISVCYDETLAARICDALREGINQKVMDKRDYRLTRVNIRMKGQRKLQRTITVDDSCADFAASLLAQLRRSRK